MCSSPWLLTLLRFLSWSVRKSRKNCENGPWGERRILQSPLKTVFLFCSQSLYCFLPGLPLECQLRPKRAWWYVCVKLDYKIWQDSGTHPGVRGKWRQHGGFYVCSIRYLKKIVKVYSNWTNLLRRSSKFTDEHTTCF